MAEEKITDPSEEEEIEGEEEKSPKKTPEGEEEGELEPEIEEVPTRRSTLQHIVARKTKTIDKLRRKLKEGEEGEEKEEEGEELTPEAASLIDKKVAEGIEPLRKHIISQEDERELASVLDDEENYPGAGKMEKTIRKYMEHPAWQQVPVAAIYSYLASKGKGGEGKKKVADLEGKLSRTGGHSRRPTKTTTGELPDVEEMEGMKDEEFEDLQFKARTGKFIKTPQ